MVFKSILGSVLLLTACAGLPFAFALDTATQTLHFEVHIEPVFYVESSSEEGGASIQLGPILPHAGPAVQRAKVVIHANRPGPYQIHQWLEQKLTNEEGEDLEEIQFVVSDGVEGGRSEIKSPIRLTTDPTILFSSPGGPDQFTITYSSSAKGIIPSGKYRARIQIEGKLK